MASPTDSELSAAANPRLAGDASDSRGLRVVEIFRRFLSCNPLYLASAGLLLYGVNRLSSEPAFVGAEAAQINFNFTALLIYEMLLVVTAIVLARRAIWYDALLLVGLENLFVLIPFSLISRAVQFDEPVGQKLCAAAVLLAVLKFWALRRYIPRLNLPSRLLAFGAVVMAVNAALALGLRRIYDEPGAVNCWLALGWFFGLPALFALGNFLPKPSRAVASPEQRAWLPHAALGIWIAVTACHLGGMGYVFTFAWHLALLAPALWVLAWTAVLQLRRFVSETTLRWQGLILLSPLLAPVIGLSDGRLVFTLELLNVAVFIYVWWRDGGKTPLGFSLASLAIGLAGTPASWAAAIMPGFNRPEWMVCCVALCCLGPIVVSRNPRLTVMGGLAAYTAAAVAADRAGWSLHWAAQVALFFALGHSLRWRDAGAEGTRLARVLIAVAWVAQSFFWSRADTREAALGCALSGGTLLTLYGFHRLLAGAWAAVVIPLASAIVIVIVPGTGAAERLKSISPGYLAVAVSFLSFVAGTIAALTKSRWNKAPPARLRV